MNTDLGKFSSAPAGALECDGKAVKVNGMIVAFITRVFSHVDVGSCTVRYRNKVAHYRVEMFATDQEIECSSLREAHGVALSHVV